MEHSFEKLARVYPDGYISPHIRPLVPKSKWYVWKYEGKAKKVRSPKTLETFLWKEKDGSWEQNKHLFGSYEEALKVYRNSPDLQGIGTLIESERKLRINGKEHYVVAVEIDDCLDPGSGEIIIPWVKDLVRTADTYTEISPSSKSIHILGLGKRPPDTYSKLPKEFTGGIDAHVYGGGVGKRYPITFTGVPLYNKPLTSNIQNWLDTDLPRKKTSSKPRQTSEHPLTEEDLKEERKEAIKRIAKKRGTTAKEVLRECRESRLSAPEEKLRTLHKVSPVRFKELWTADKEVFNGDSQHEADLALCLMLASVTGLEPRLMDGLFRNSGLYRDDKWEQEQYRLLTLNTALKGCDRVYTPPKRHLGEGGQPSRDVPMGKPLLSDVESIKKLIQIKGGRFVDLWQGKTGDYGTPEKAHLALCSDLAFITQNDEESIDRLFRNSGLCDYQWDDESYRIETIRASFQQNIYTGEPNPKESVRRPILNALEEIRLNLAYGCKHGLHACYIYYALIRKGLYGEELNLSLRDDTGDRWTRGTDLLVSTTDIDLQLESGLYTKNNFAAGKKLLLKEGLVDTLRKGNGRKPSVYRLKSPEGLPKEIIPYPPGFIGTLTDCKRFVANMERIEIYGLQKGGVHPLEEVGYRVTKKKIPKQLHHSWSSLNSMAAWDKNIRDICGTRLNTKGPDGYKIRGYKGTDGRKVNWIETHPPLALSPPFNLYDSPFLHALLVEPSDVRMSEEIKWRVIHMEGLSQKQKFALEQIDQGRCSLLELMKFFDEKRKDNLRRVLVPLIEKGLLEEQEDPIVGRCYKKTENFEQIVNIEFEKSGSRMRFEEKVRAFSKKREEYKEKLKGSDETTIEEEIEKHNETVRVLKSFEVWEGSERKEHL